MGEVAERIPTMEESVLGDLSKRTVHMKSLLSFRRCGAPGKLRRTRRTIRMALAVSATLLSGPLWAKECPTFDPVRTVQALSHYSDEAGSDVDVENREATFELTRSIRQLVSYSADAMDSRATERIECSFGRLKEWAAAGALLGQPTNFAGKRQRLRYAQGINVVLLKAADNGKRIDVVQDWAQQVTRDVVADFRGRKRIDNLRIASGIAAASSALLVADPRLEAYGARTLALALKAITAEGFVPAELTRGSRARLYHAAYLSGVITLKAIMERLAEEHAVYGEDRVSRLAQTLSESFCNPSVLSSKAKVGYQQDVPLATFAPICALTPGLWQRTLARCVRGKVPMVNPAGGGDWRELGRILESPRLPRG